MKEWSVYIEAWAPDGNPGSIDAADSRVGDLSAALQPYAAVTSVDHYRWAVQTTLAAVSAQDAASRAADIVTTAAGQCRMPTWPIERLEVVELERRDADLAVSNFPHLVGTAEVAELLGVSRQRIHELRKADRFPEPMIELAAGPIWLRPAIEKWDAERDRRPGRRPKVDMSVADAADMVLVLEEARRENGGLTPEEETAWIQVMYYLKAKLSAKEVAPMLHKSSEWVTEEFDHLPDNVEAPRS
jgi:hypothetical protein